MIGDLGFAIKDLNNSNKKETKKASVAKLRYAWDPEVSNRSPRGRHPPYSCVHLEISTMFFLMHTPVKIWDFNLQLYSQFMQINNNYTVTCSLVCKSLELA